MHMVLLLIFAFFWPSTCFSNNVSVSGVSLGAINGAGSYSLVEFDVGWENSWRVSSGPSNWDAVWLFVKFSKDGGTTWEHASLHNSGHVAPSDMSITVGLEDTGSAFNATSNPGIGVFLFRSSDGSGAISANNVGLRWNFGEDGVLSSDSVLLQVYALEMVFVPQGSFFAGDTSSTATFVQGSGDIDPWEITGEGAINVTNAVSDGYYYQSDFSGTDDATGAVFTIPAGFPKGYGSFYVMKYEVAQGDWVSFFNTLTSSQQTTRDITSNVNGGKNSDGLVWRNNVSWSGSGAATLNGGTHGDVAMNYLSWADLTAYLDWSGLRPMSELEFEKAARGAGQPAVPIEYAWGTALNVQVTGLTNNGASTEIPSDGVSANLTHNSGTSGPIRVGSLASGSSSRVDSGASYYGAMELSGNVWERTVTVGNTNGRTFTGDHGNGTLSNAGDADVSSWPGTNAQGAGLRGGSWFFAAPLALVSDRYAAALPTTVRFYDWGGRGARLAPSLGG